MKKIYLMVCTVLFICGSKAQNLVPNSSFENYINCPNGLSDFGQTASWSAVNGHGGTPDLFNVCDTGQYSAGVPVNLAGYQYAAYGKGYAGIATWYQTGNTHADIREYIQTQLKAPMTAGTCYKVSYKYSLANLFPGGADGFGILFSSSAITATNGYQGVLFFTPQIQHPLNVLMNDTVNWVTETYTYTANGTEKYMTLGNFRTNAATHHPSSGSWDGCYLYLDDINVRPCNEPAPYLTASGDTLCYGDPVTFTAHGYFDEVQWTSSLHPDLILSTDTVFTVYPSMSEVYTLHSSNYTGTFPIVVRQDCVPDPVIPNVFSPDGDGLNDLWKFSLDSSFVVTGFEIYNRWGNSIIKVKPEDLGPNPTIEWNGKTSAGQESVSGVYYYVLVYKDQYRKEQRRQGCISLFR